MLYKPLLWLCILYGIIKVVMAIRSTPEKRHGKHHKQTKPFLSVYHPYLPLLLLAIIIVVFFSFGNSKSSSVLSYATDISPSELLSKTNEERKSDKKPALKLNPELSEAAQAKAEDMTTRNYWSHTTPDGKAPWVFIDQAGYSYDKAGENLAYGFSTSANTIYAWMNSSQHRANILDSAFSEVGFGITNSSDFLNQGQETVVVAMYGAPVGSVAGSLINTKEGINTASLLSSEPRSRKITKIDLFAQGSAPWAASVIGILIGACLALLFIKHSLALKRALRRGERFVVKHPLIDILVVAAICIGIVLISGAGLVR